MASPMPPEFDAALISEPPLLPPEFDESLISDPPVLPPEFDTSLITTPPLDKARAEKDIEAIAKRVQDIENPVQMLRAIATDPDLMRDTLPESRDLFRRSMESEVVPQLQKILGITDETEAKRKLYEDPSVVDYGRELTRSFVPQTQITMGSQIRGFLRGAAINNWRDAIEYVKRTEGIQDDEQAELKLNQLVQERSDKKSKRGFWDMMTEGGWVKEEDRYLDAAMFARQSSEEADKLGREMEEIRKKNPDDPRIAGTNLGSFIEGIAQTPANLATMIFPGVNMIANYSQLYDEAYEQAFEVAKKEKREITKEQAHRMANIAALINTPIETAADYVLKGVMPKKLRERVEAFAKTNPKSVFLGKVTTKALTEAFTELGQGAVTNVVTGAPVGQQASQNFFGGMGGGMTASVMLDTAPMIRDEVKRLAREKAAAAGPATAAAVESNPAVQDALSNLTPSRNYAEEQRKQLEEQQRNGNTEPKQEPPTNGEVPPASQQGGTPPNPAGNPPASNGATSTPAPDPIPDEITYAEWETGGGMPLEHEPESGQIEPEDVSESTLDGVPVQRVAAASIVSRPDLMQFKRIDDAATGVNEVERLEGEWDDLKAGVMLLWEPENPALHGLQDGERYIIANGHHRKEFGDRAGTTGYNVQILREADGYSAADARRLGAEINIADNKGTIYDQAKYLRDTAATLGADEAVEVGRRIGARGRKAATIAFSAADPLFEAFINERISPDHVEAIASAVPRDEGPQRVGMRAALNGQSPQMAANLARAAMLYQGGEAKTQDLFGADDAAIMEMERQAQRATEVQKGLREQVLSVQGAARRPEVAARLGVNVNDPEGVQKRIAELRAELDRWSHWPMHPDLVAITRGQETPPPSTPQKRGPSTDMFAGQTDDPFNLVSETDAERRAREAREQAEAEEQAAREAAEAKAEQDRQQRTLFVAPTVMRGKYDVGAEHEINGRRYRVKRDLGGHVELEAIDIPGLTRIIEKPTATLDVQRLMNMARLKLGQYMANVGHSGQVYDGPPHAPMYVGIEDDNEPRIYVNWEKLLGFTVGMDETEALQRIELGLSEEIIHVAEIRFQQQNPELTAKFLDWVNNPEAVGHDPAFVQFMRDTYTGYDQLAPYQKAAEAARVIIQKRWMGTITESVIAYLRGFLDYINRFVAYLTQENHPYVTAYINGIEDILFGRTAHTNPQRASERSTASTLPTTPFVAADMEALRASLSVEGFSLDSDQSYFEATGGLQITDRFGGTDRATFMVRPQRTNMSAQDVVAAVREKRETFMRANQVGLSDQRVNDLLDRLSQGEDFALEELDEWKRWRYGAPPQGQSGQHRGQRFYTPEAFERAFEAAFAAKDFDAIVDMVKASDAAIYGPILKKLFRAQASDPVAAHKAEWLRSVFNGMRPADAPPPTATTPPPPKPKGPPPQPKAQPGAQQQNFNNMPPPPPPAAPPPPAGKVRFNIPALVYLSRKLGQLPSINTRLKRTRGRFVSMQNGVKVELHPDIFKNPEQAAKTLAHEIGHFFDYIPHAVKNANLASKVAPLRNWRAVFGTLWDWSGHKIGTVNQMLKDEAIALSKAWRGDFDRADRYRNSAAELYADFISALLNNPQWTFTVAPRLSAAFFAGLQAKPEVELAYNLVNDLLRSNVLLEVLQQEQAASGARAVEGMIQRSINRAAEMISLRRAWTALYGGFVNRYGPTMEKAGGYWHAMHKRLSAFGKDYVSEQELAATFSERHIYKMGDELKAGTYIPLEAAGISQADLDTYLRNRRIIHERTATGVYLQSDPDEAREVFKWMVSTAGIDPAFIDEIDNTPDGDLYELGARIVWAIHDAGVFDAVYRAAQSAQAPDFAERGLFAFDVSGFQLNPQGIDPTSAQQQLDMIQSRLGPDRWKVLQDAAKNYYSVFRGIVTEANSLGLFRPSTWNERIAPNLNNYVPFLVIDYFTGHVDPGIKQKEGTAQDILPTHIAGQLKAAAMLRRMQRQKQALLTKSFFETEGKAYGFDGELTVHSKPLTQQQQDEIRRDGKGLIGFYRKGQWTWMEFEDGSAVQAMEQFDPDDLASLINLGRAQSNFWRLLFTVYSVSFTLWNALRTVRQMFDSHGFRNLANLAKVAPEAKVYANAVLRGTPLTPELRDMVAAGAIPAPDRSLAGQGNPKMLERMILSGMVSAQNMMNRTPHSVQNKTVQLLRKPFGWLIDGIAWLSGFVESSPKLATFKTLRERGADVKEASAFARLEGIPNPGISGKYNGAMEVVLMFARVHIQGMRAFRTRAMHPRTKGGFMTRAVLSQIIHKSLYAAMAAGAVDRIMDAIRGDDDEPSVDWQEMVKRTTPYKLEMDDMIYLGWVTDNGGYALPFGHKVIPKDWTPLSIRIPHSEDGRYISPFVHTLITNIFQSDIRPVDSAQRMIQWAQGFIPGANPGFDLISVAWQIDNDSPPQDSYRGQPTVPKDEWEAGYFSRIWGIGKYFMRTVGVPGFQHTIKNPDLNWFWTAVRETPGLNRLVPLDNYGGIREERREQREQRRTDARARNMRGKQTVAAIRRLEALERKGSPNVDEPKSTARTSAEEAEYQRLREWYSDYYHGSAENPGLFFILKAKAAGQDVDADYARETLEKTAKEALEEARELWLSE